MATSFRIPSDTQYLASWQYLVNWVLVVILGLAFVFYFARLVGYVISIFLNIFLWKRHHVDVTIGAFRVAPLGGRIMARNVVISTADYTVSILRLNLTWRYWLLRMTRLPQFHFGAESLESSSGLSEASNSGLPTSLLLHIDGLEVFMYNRTAAYENIEHTLRKFESDPENASRNGFSAKLSAGSASHTASGSSAAGSEPPLAGSQSESGLNFWLRILPLQVTVRRGAFVLGNHTTPSILVASFRTAKALLDVSRAPSALDLFRTSFDIDMDRFQVHMKPNITYDPERYTSGRPESFRRRVTAAFKHTFRNRSFKGILAHLKLQTHRKTRNKTEEWHGLRRYVGEFPQERLVELNDIEEYAKYSLILDSVATSLVYYYDTPGIQPTKESVYEASTSSPESGVDIVLSMATIHYGSWADRQRGPLQALLFPSLAHDAEPSMAHNEPGSLRSYAGFNLSVSTSNELILRVPTREFSKDKEELATQEDPKSKNTRPFGWLELKLGKGTDFKYINSYVASARGWPNTLSLIMEDLEMRTSVTHDVLFTADRHTVNAEIGFPLAWNGECTWTFNMDSSNGKFFFLREHITLFIDLVSDFGSGPPAKFENFRPFTYYLNWTVRDFMLYFNVNDHNIINDPLDFDSNKFVCFSGPKMDVSSKIPLRGMFSTSSSVEYRIFAPSLDLTLVVPPWHTVSAFMKGSKKMGSTGAFEISGFYNYYSKVELDHNNFASINIIGDDITLLFHGYLIKYLFAFRENYFGDFVNFRTFEEYMLSEGMDTPMSESQSMSNSLRNRESLDSFSKERKTEYWKLLKAENDLNILFTFKARQGLIIFPCQLYDHTHHLGLSFDYLDVEIHLCQYYMDLQADFSTGEGYQVLAGSMPSRDTVFERLDYNSFLSTREPDVIIDTFSIHTHRMLGIDDLTYQCKWDFACDLISINGPPTVLTSIDTFLNNFILGYKDLENSLTYQVPTVYDAAHFSFRCPQIILKLQLSAPNLFLDVQIHDVLATFNDVANFRYSSRVSLLLPKILLRIVDESSEFRYYVTLDTSLHITNFGQKADMKEHRDSQHEHIKRNDATTHRASFLLYPEEKDSQFEEAQGSVFPTVSLPMASHPLTEEYLSQEASNESQQSSLDSFSEYSSSKESSYVKDEMHPTTAYIDEDFKPTNSSDQYKTDSLILNFETVKVSACPEGLRYLSELALGIEGYEMNSLLDALHYEVMRDLKRLIMPVSMIDNFRFVSPLIDFRMVEDSMLSPQSAFSTTHSKQVFTLTISEPSLVMQLKHVRTRLGSYLEEQSTLTFAFHASELYASVSIPNCFSAACIVQASEVESWLTKNEESASVASFSINALTVDIQQRLLPDVFSFCSSLMAGMDAAINNLKKASRNAAQWRRDLLYSLCNFATVNNISSDPEVITKPARTLRSNRDHARIYESWKIMTKLRSIANEMRARDDTRYDPNNEAQRAPEDAMLWVIESFKAWRPWEGNMKQRELFFRQVFSESVLADSKLQTYFNLDSIKINLQDKDDSLSCVSSSGLCAQASVSQVHNNGKSDMRDQTGFTKVDIVLNMGVVDLSLMASIVTLSKFLGASQSSHKDLVSGGRKVEVLQSALQFSLLVNLSSLHSKLCFTKTHFELALSELTVALIGSVSAVSDLSLGWASKLGELSFSFHKQDDKFLRLSLDDTVILLSGLKNASKMDIVMDHNTKASSLEISDYQNTLHIAMVEFLDDDLGPLLDSITSVETKIANQESSAKSSQTAIPNITSKFIVERFSFSIDVLSPLRIHGQLTGARTNVLVSEQECFAEYFHAGFSSEIALREMLVLRLKNSDSHMATVLQLLEGAWLVKTDVKSEYLKLMTPSILKAFDTALRSKQEILDKSMLLRGVLLKSQLINKLRGPPKIKQGTNVGDEESKTKVLFKCSVSQKYLGWFAYKEQSRYTVEFEDFGMTLANTPGLGLLSSLVSGELVIPGTRLTIYDPSYSVGLSTLLDFHLSVKVLNDVSTESDGISGQSLQVESEHFRVCLSPQVLLKIFELADGLKRTLDNLGGSMSPRPLPEVDSDERNEERKPMFTSVHVLSYNFCIGWLFGSSHKDYPGLILGAERIFAVTKADMGKLTVMGGYLSVAHGSSSSNFYSSTSEIDNLNRAFMPKVQLNYYIDANRKLWLTLKGDELDVRLMSNSTVLIERGIVSGTEVRAYFEAKSRRADLIRQNSENLKFAIAVKPDVPSKAFEPYFSAMQSSVGFAGARIFIYKLQEDSLHEEPNSLTLQSPAVSIAVDYHHVKNATLKHVLKAEMLMSQSDNTVYSSCVPVVEDFVRTFKDIFKGSSAKQHEGSRSQNEDSSSNTGADFGNLFREADIHIGIRIEKQRVSLSCEPTAKVAAIVEYDGASISACSGVESFDSIYILGQINEISASLQHIYSDERSGSLMIKNIMLSSMLGFKDNLDIISTCCITDICGYVKMKQYQDVDLFRDIWFPKQYDSNSEEKDVGDLTSHEINSTSGKASSGSDYSVALDFIFANIALEVDFGPALGTMILDIDKAWAISRKISNWSYEFKLGLQTVLVGSEGRLGGYLKTKGIFLNSAIDWKLDELPLLDIPLVHMAAGFNELQFKSIFDEHVFAFVSLKNWRFDVFNRKNGANISKDHLFVSIRYSTAEAYLTSLAVSDFYDIYETISRMIEEKRSSYKEILKDSNKETFMKRACSNDFLEVAKKLDTQIEVFTGLTTLQVYPHSFHDTKVFVIQLDRSTANFTQNEYEFGVSNQIELQLNNVKASFSSTAGTSKESTRNFDVDELSEYASKAKGGTILGFPRFMISMRTYQKYQTNVVEYLFQSSFGGTVDIRWNLGSVNCVREMYSAHKRALLSRTEVTKDNVPAFKDDLELNEMITQDSARLRTEAEEDATRMLASAETPHKDFDKDIQQTFENVTSKSKFTYKALAPAIIEAPQLKELGNATPPLEWFGLHRNKFPDATHQLAIVTLQKLIHEIELEYSKTLEKA